MPSTALDREYRERALADLPTREFDLLVIGGGVTGAGIALDAATRGLDVALVEAQDWSAGTSSRSSRLVHGGLRYLYNLDFKLVAESLRERARLLTTVAPHLVTPQPFLWPLRQRVIERSYSAIGVGMYDALAYVGARRRTVPFQKHLSKAATLRTFPDAREDSLIGSIRFYDTRVDDARLTLSLVRTAVGYGAVAANRAEVTGVLRDGERVAGAVVVDQETGQRVEVRAKETIGAVGVWTDHLQQLAGVEPSVRVLASKGIHLVIPRDRIHGETGMFLRTEKSVLFIIPWPEHWIIGTTDTPWEENLTHPVATAADVAYLLEHANAVLRSNLTVDDVVATYAGLRPLLQPVRGATKDSAKVSREHTVARLAPGLSVIAGGKLTTYRQMAEDAVDFVLGARAAELPCVTATTPVVGSEGYAAAKAVVRRRARELGWAEDVVTHVWSRYGAETLSLMDLIGERPELGDPLASAPRHLVAEVVHAVTHEGALHVEDVLTRRVRLAAELPEHGLAALDEVAGIMAPLLGWDDRQVETEKDAWRRYAEAHEAALTTLTDADGMRPQETAGLGEIGEAASAGDGPGGSAG